MVLRDIFFLTYIFGIPLAGLVVGAVVGFKKKKYLGLIVGVIFGIILAVILQIIIATLSGGGGLGRIIS